jgi:hypothetical protein
LKAIEVFKRFGRGYKPRPASESNDLSISLLKPIIPVCTAKRFKEKNMPDYGGIKLAIIG